MEQRFVPSPIIDFHVQTTLTSPTAPTHAPSPAAFDTAQAIDPPALDMFPKIFTSKFVFFSLNTYMEH